MKVKKKTARWKSRKTTPTKRGWYETKTRDGYVRWRAWGQGQWWIPLGGSNAEGGWMAVPGMSHQWRLPRVDVMKPMPEPASQSPTEGKT